MAKKNMKSEEFWQAAAVKADAFKAGTDDVSVFLQTLKADDEETVEC